MLERGIERGEFRRIDPQQAMNIVVAPMLMLVMWKHSFTSCGAINISPDGYLNSFIDLFLHGLLSGHSAPST
jgi:hypothetical protein